MKIHKPEERRAKWQELSRISDPKEFWDAYAKYLEWEAQTGFMSNSRRLLYIMAKKTVEALNELDPPSGPPSS